MTAYEARLKGSRHRSLGVRIPGSRGRAPLTTAILFLTSLLVPALGPTPGAHAVVNSRSLAGSATAGPSQRDLIEWVRSTFQFSPNGDGRRDTARVVFDLAKPARVTARVTAGPHPNGETILHAQSLHRLEAGRHRWVWDGRDDGGTIVEDGDYQIWITARRGAATRTLQVAAKVDTAVQGRLVTSRPTVYPRAKVVDDHVQLVYAIEGWNPYDVWWGEDNHPRTRLRILNHHGKVVWQAVVKDHPTPAFDWDARRADGSPLPQGAYRARLRTVDQAGNVQRLSRRLTVSHAQLVEKVWSSTVSASTAVGYAPWFDPGCNDCPYYAWPVASDRYPGGLSFRAPPLPGPWGTYAAFVMGLPFAPAPVDTYRVSAVGGPTTPGAADSASLSAGRQVRVEVRGDSVSSTPWAEVDLDFYPYLPELEWPINWAFATYPGNSYDVATFTIDYRYYLPARS